MYNSSEEAFNAKVRMGEGKPTPTQGVGGAKCGALEGRNAVDGSEAMRRVEVIHASSQPARATSASAEGALVNEDWEERESKGEDAEFQTLQARVVELAAGLQHALKLQLFGFDVLECTGPTLVSTPAAATLATRNADDAEAVERDSTAGTSGGPLFVVDVNYFPSYTGVTDMRERLACLAAEAVQKQKVGASAAESAAPRNLTPIR